MPPSPLSIPQPVGPALISLIKGRSIPREMQVENSALPSPQRLPSGSNRLQDVNLGVQPQHICQELVPREPTLWMALLRERQKIESRFPEKTSKSQSDTAREQPGRLRSSNERPKKKSLGTATARTWSSRLAESLSGHINRTNGMFHTLILNPNPPNHPQTRQAPPASPGWLEKHLPPKWS